MSANLRILKRLAENLETLSNRYTELKPIHIALKARIGALEKRKEELERQRKTLRYPIPDLDNDVKAFIKLPVARVYSGKTIDRVVYDFLKRANQQIKDRYDGASTCERPESVSDWSLDALAGLEQEKAAVRDAWIRPRQWSGMYIDTTRGILLYGPPGTGKTVLAKAMSNALPGTAFFPVDASKLKSKWLGGTEKLIAAKFDCASDIVEEESDKFQAAIVFVDEIDSVAADRSSAESGSASAASTQAFLIAMDGFFSSERVAVLGATNTPWNIDAGVLRRFDERIFLDLPTLAARIGIILDSIVKYFAPPWISKKQREHRWADGVPRRPNAAQGEATVFDAMLNPSNYAGASSVTWNIFNALSEGNVRILTVNGKASPPEKVLTGPTTRDIILEVARMMGPRPSQKDKMSSARAAEPLEFYDKATSNFGYNASDIAKVIKKASTIAASKTLYEPNVYEAYWRPIPDQLYPEETPQEERGHYYAVFPKEVSDELDFPREIAARRAGSQAKLVNITLSMEDIKEAMNQIGSSVREEDYLRLLEFRKRG
jgi:SpoVK/Ycf46/Vps4 family AAA+-type ATPase